MQSRRAFSEKYHLFPRTRHGIAVTDEIVPILRMNSFGHFDISPRPRLSVSRTDKSGKKIICIARKKMSRWLDVTLPNSQVESVAR